MGSLLLGGVARDSVAMGAAWLGRLPWQRQGIAGMMLGRLPR